MGIQNKGSGEYLELFENMERGLSRALADEINSSQEYPPSTTRQRRKIYELSVKTPQLPCSAAEPFEWPSRDFDEPPNSPIE